MLDLKDFNLLFKIGDFNGSLVKVNGELLVVDNTSLLFEFQVDLHYRFSVNLESRLLQFLRSQTSGEVLKLDGSHSVLLLNVLQLFTGV